MKLGRLQAFFGCLTLGLALGSPARADRPEPTAKQAAKGYYEQGVVSYKAGRLREAIESFLAADRLVPSPALSFNVARAYERLGESARALEHYRDYVRRGPDPGTVEGVKKRVASLEADLAKKGVQQISVRSQPAGAQVTINGELRGTTPWTGELVPGTHRLVVASDGHSTQELQVELAPTKSLDVAVALAPAVRGNKTDVSPVPPRPVPREVAEAPTPRTTEASSDARFGAWPWVTLGAGGAALAGASVFEILRRDAESDAEDEVYQPRYHDHRERMESHQTNARVLLALGGALGVGGGVLLLLDGKPSRERSSATLAPPSLACTTSSCMGALRGQF